MPRNGGSLIDVNALTVRGRDGSLFPLELAEVANGRLHAGRRVTETPRFNYLEAWVVPEEGWAIAQFSRDGTPVPPEWYVETEIIEVTGSKWSVQDGYIDFLVFEGSHYEIQDMNELADGIAAGDISIEEGLRVLHSAHRLAEALKAHGFSCTALLATYGFAAPDPGYLWR